MRAIYKRELSSYFNSMIGYIFVAITVFYIGIYFMANNIYSGYIRFSYTLMTSTLIFIIVVPILTMKSMAEEKRSKTDQILLTAPISVTSIVLGKYLAMISILLIPVGLCALCPLIIKLNGEAALLSDYVSIVAFFLMGCVFVAIGQFISALTESQVIAAVGTFGALFVLYLWSDLMTFLPEWLGSILSAFAFREVFYNFALYNVLDIGGIFMYLSMSFVFVFLTIQAVQKRRWS